MTQNVQEYFGGVSIIIGLFLCSIGASFLIYFFMAFVFVGLLVIMNLYSYNIFTNAETPVVQVAVLVLAVSVVSMFLSRFLVGFAKKWALLLISAWVGIVIVLSALKVLKITDASINIIGALFGTVLGYNLCIKYYNTIPSFCASFIGAFFIIKGISSYIGHYPEEGH